MEQLTQYGRKRVPYNTKIVKKRQFNKIRYYKFDLDKVNKRDYKSMNEEELRLLLWIRRNLRLRCQKYLMEKTHVKPRFK